MGEPSPPRLRILLVAHEFPPIPSPHSLRWAYLGGELAKRGHQLTVSSPASRGYGPGGLPALPASVVVERIPVPLWVRLLQGDMPWRRIAPSIVPATDSAPSVVVGPHKRPGRHLPAPLKHMVRRVVNALYGQRHASRLNWRGRLAERLKTLCSRWVFPDYRGGWISAAAPRVRELLDGGEMDVVITSHEPACATLLISRLHPFKALWVADLGDPILATYTPDHWRTEARRLEGHACQSADLVTVTSEGTKTLLQERHGLSPERCFVLTQGFTRNGETPPESDIPFDTDRLELLYTGSFYSFRSPDALIEAVLGTPRVRLTVASVRVPDALENAARQHPERIRLIGFQRHDATLSLQRAADIIISIGNADPVQVPGKVYEYLGSGRPILHIADADDGVAQLLRLTGRGHHCAGNAPAISHALEMLRHKKGGFSMPSPEIDASIFSWANQAKQLEAELLRRLENKNTRAGSSR